MATNFVDVIIVNYSGPQGSRELQYCESATLNRTKSRARVKTMNRGRRAVGFQSGTEEASVSLTVVPQLVDPEVNWVQAWKQNELFTLVLEKGLGGVREQVIDCMVVSVNDTANENGEAKQEVSIEGLVTVEEP